MEIEAERIKTGGPFFATPMQEAWPPFFRASFGCNHMMQAQNPGDQQPESCSVQDNHRFIAIIWQFYLCFWNGLDKSSCCWILAVNIFILQGCWLFSYEPVRVSVVRGRSLDRPGFLVNFPENHIKSPGVSDQLGIFPYFDCCIRNSEKSWDLPRIFGWVSPRSRRGCCGGRRSPMSVGLQVV